MAHIYSIASATGLTSTESLTSFKFGFMVNEDEQVYYQGYYMSDETTFNNGKTLAIDGFQSRFNVDIIDTNKLIRDFPNLTKDHLRDITKELMLQCISYSRTGKLTNKPTIFNVNIDSLE
jgi:hypothetical protein